MFNNFWKKKIKDIPTPESPQAAILIHLLNGNLTITADWSDDVDMSQFGAVIATIATGEMVGPIVSVIAEKLKELDDEQSLQTIYDVIKERIAQVRNNAANEAGENRPVVAPVEAIHRQLTMYQNSPG